MLNNIMTEAALTKLSYLLAVNNPHDSVGKGLVAPR